MKAIFLGTNGWYDTAIGSTTCILIDAEKQYIIFDAGFGFYKIGRYVTEKKPISLFISHLHLDHIIGLHALLIFKFKQGIDLYLPQGLRQPLEMVVNKPFSTPFDELPTKIRFHELSKGELPDFKCLTKLLHHVIPCTGFRLELEGRIITYCTDTSKCDALYELAKDADLFITECAFRPGEHYPIKNFHMNPEEAAAVAKRANVKRLALIHFDPGRYPTQEDRERAGEIARQTFANTVATKDGNEIMV